MSEPLEPDILTRQAALDLLPKQNALIAQLWGMYVAATFAAAVFNLHPGPSDWRVSAAVTLGFLTFTLGHWSLLLQALRVSRALAVDIQEAIGTNEIPFMSSIQALLRTANPPYVSGVCHIVIDTCVVASIWVTFLQGHNGG